MKKRPTIALACIMKNEAHNLGPFLKSFGGCVDAMFFTDTGSTDNSVEILKNQEAQDLAQCPIHISHFDWIKDFSAARQFNFDQVPKEFDYIMWADLDDVLSDQEKFIHWRDHTMHCGHQWLVNYNYAYDGGVPVCTFFRERIIKNNHGFKWKYFLHEGLIQTSDRKTDTQFIGSFTINHNRSIEDEKADRARNINVFEHHIRMGSPMPVRMKYYYGKELFDADQFLPAAEMLQQVCETAPNGGLELHDRIMATQYLSMAYGKCGKWEKSLHIALNGLQLAPDRSELWVCIGDALLQSGKVNPAKVFYEGAKHCSGGTVGGALYTSPRSRNTYPSHQLAQIYISQWNWKAAQKEVDVLKDANDPSAIKFQTEINQLQSLDKIPQKLDLIDTDDIVISTPPGSITGEWDENVLATKGLGGSETAAVEVARLLKKHTKRPVKIFMNRKTSDIMESGVEYLPLTQLEDYMRRYLPHRHIAWRHCSKLTEAPTFVWSHDLITQRANNEDCYEKLWCLTEFHKNFVMDMQGVNPEKIDLVQNGIDPDLFHAIKADRNPNKVIFSSSPDRGWERCIEICKRARKEIPDLELHLFYGTGNMRKMGMEAQADKLDALVKENDFVHYHGFVSKKDLITHYKQSSIWLYPADFIETSCITAMEALCSGTYPLVRDMGALKYTMKQALDDGMATMLQHDACDDETYQLWADELVKHIKEKSYEKVKVNIDDYSWETRLKDYLHSMDL